MQMVVHPRMWEYGAGSQLPESEDGLASDNDADIDTLTLSYTSRSNEDGAEDSSYDGIVDLTSSASETSLGLRRSQTFGSLRSDNHVPELFDMDRHTGFRRQRDAPVNTVEALLLLALCLPNCVTERMSIFIFSRLVFGW